MDMEIGALLPHAGRAASPDNLRDMAQGAESLGVDSLWVGDHIVLPAAQSSDYPYRGQGDSGNYEVPSDRPYLESFQSLAFVAASTSRCGLGLSVGILPYRHPLLWAKSVGTLSTLARGRFTLGVGAGWLEEEFRALDVDYQHRGELTDRVLSTLREVWADSEGRTQVDDRHAVHVVPAFEGAPPAVWVGGTGKVALKRTARFGDTWHPHVRGSSPERVAAGLAAIGELAEEYDRKTSGAAALLLPFSLEASEGAPPWEIGRMSGPANYCADLLARYAEVGVRHVVLSTGGSPQRRLRQYSALLHALEAA